MTEFERIDSEDYFRMNDTFCIWLIKKKKVHFEDLTTKEAGKKFKKFVKHWNKKKLDPIYYDQSKLLEEHANSINTKHQWNFKLTHKDDLEMKNIAQIKSKETKKDDAPKPKVYGPARPGSQQVQTEQQVGTQRPGLGSQGPVPPDNNKINQQRSYGPIIPSQNWEKNIDNFKQNTVQKPQRN